jgi:hypothetical protein
MSITATCNTSARSRISCRAWERWKNWRSWMAKTIRKNPTHVTRKVLTTGTTSDQNNAAVGVRTGGIAT